MNLKKCIKQIVRYMRKRKTFMLHHVVDITENTEIKSSRVLSVLNFSKLCDKYQFSDMRYSNKGNFLTFDDGLIDFYYFVYPIISEKRIPVVLFMNVSFLDKPGYLTTPQLLEISESPYVTIGSHCINHLPLKTLTDKEKKFEVLESKNQLEKIIGKEIDYIAYPFGQYDKNVLKFVAAAKYKKGFSAAEFDTPRLMYRNFCFSRIDITNERINQWL